MEKNKSKKRFELIDWIKEFDNENNISDDIDKDTKDILNKNRNNIIHEKFYKNFLPNFSERLNVNSSSDIYDYEDFFSKPIANPLIDRINNKEEIKIKIKKGKEKEKEKDKEKGKIKEPKRKSNRIAEFYAKKNKFKYNNQ